MPNECSTILLNDIHTPAFEDVLQCKPNANRAPAPATKRRLAVIQDDHGEWWKAKRSGKWCRAQAAEGLAAQGQVVVGRVAVVVKPKVERATSEPEVGPPENPLKSALREFQRTKGCTLTHIGSLLGGCSKGTVSNWLNGVRMGDAAVLALNERVQALLARGSSAEAGAEVGPVPVREARRPLLTVEAQTAVDAAAVAKQAKETDEARAAREAREAAAKKARAAKEQAKEALAKEAREAREAKEARHEAKEAMHEARHEAAAKAAAEAAVEEAASAQRYAAESVERLQRNDKAREQQCKAHAAQLRALVLAGRLQDVETYVKQLIAAMPSSASRDTIRRLQDAIGPAVDALVEMAEVACEVGQGRRPITAVDADAAAAATQPQAASGTINTATAPGPAAPATATDTDTVAVAAAPGTSTAIAGASSPAASVTVTATVTAATTQAASGTTSTAIAPGPVAPATDTDTDTVAATADPELQDLLRWLLHVKLSESEYLLPRSGTLTEPSSSTAHAAALAALDTRLNRHTRVKEAVLETGRQRLAMLPNVAADARIKEFEQHHGEEWSIDKDYLFFCCSDNAKTWGKARQHLISVLLPKVAEILQMEDRDGAEVAQARAEVAQHCKKFAQSLPGMQAHVLAAAEKAKKGIAIANFPSDMSDEDRFVHALCRACRLVDTTFGQIETIGPGGMMCIVVRVWLCTARRAAPCCLP